ncbi:phospholipase D-like domain-containing protein [Glycomyces sp. TRM65418]|uniref:phospholipase D-like domain-containing protein n=1 Tax=Glycomyces sp. TRM65418 TaxID=2867006 RepID=UPI001CE6CE86|nr:phospholipase D-like domain-containing protein [Glycomyces sp. TRM65418]MCC3762289.1 phospholipase D-like domain-containing protein [Glycomyces sp. TRM65418]QZD56344.1 hypothetical protein K3N28_04260 [Glycomyces sp. TRM65418]
MHRSALAMAAAGAVLATLTVSASVPAADTAAIGCVRSGDYTVCRTDPGGGEDTTIVAEVVRHVGTAQEGDTVRAAFFQLTLEEQVAPVTEVLVEAQGRGADVGVVVGRGESEPDASAAAVAKLEDAGVTVRECEGACLPTPSGEGRGPHHNRFFLIDRGGEPTVLVTSFNFKGAHAEQAHNLLGVHSDRELFDFYRGFWDRLHRGEWDGWGPEDRHAATDRARAWVFPRTGDPIVQGLEQITGCEQGDRVLVGHANFQSNRPAVRDQLDRVQGLGCQVRVVLTDKDENAPAWIERALGDANVRIHGAHRNKFIVVEAQFGDRRQALVWTGTHNLTANSLQQTDDNILQVADQEVAELYAQFFQRLWQGAR